MVKLHVIGNIAFRVYGNDHRPAHFHIVAPDYKAMVSIETLAVIRGTIPSRDCRAVMDWAAEHKLKPPRRGTSSTLTSPSDGAAPCRTLHTSRPWL